MSDFTHSTLCMPSRANVPVPRCDDWKLVTCPLCGKECWESDLARSMKKKNPTLQSACTDCALKSVLK